MKGASAPLAFTALVVLCIVGLKSFQSRNDVVVQKEYLQTTELDGVGLLQARIVQRVVDESADTQNLRKTVYSSSSSADSALPVAEVVKVAPVSATAVAATSSSKQSAENSQQDIKKTGTDKNVRSFHSLRDYLKTLQDVSGGGEGKVTVKSGTAGAKIKDISSTSASSSADETPAAKPASVVQPKPAAQPTATAVVPQQQSSSPAASWAPIIARSKETTSSARFPKQSDKYINNLFAHPKVLSAFEKIKSSAHDHINEICFGPDNNMDVYINEELMQRDLMGPSNGYTVFDLDCRDKDANPLIAFILVMDQYGAIVNVYRPANRAESVVMLDTDRVLFSVIGTKGGVQVWNWRTDEVVALPFEADSHTVQYSHAQGLYFGLARAGAANRNAPSVAQAFDARGTVVWSYEQPYSHINWLTVDGDYAYLSLRSDASLIKVDRRTNAIVWSLGGKNSDFRITDLDGRVYTKEMWHDKADFDMWNHQHKFQYLGGGYFSLFDNHIDSDHAFIRGESSRMVVLQVDERAREAREVFRHATGDRAHIYGSADVVPSGNVLGNSYPDVVAPASADGQYHANLWEVTPEGELAWRVGFKGRNPFDAGDATGRPHGHAVAPGEEPPVGWVVFNVERMYEEPQLTRPCLVGGGGGRGATLRLLPFNTVRTMDAAPGRATLREAGRGGRLLDEVEFQFARAWLETGGVELWVEDPAQPLALELANDWGDVRVVDLGKAEDLPLCSSVSHHRLTSFK